MNGKADVKGAQGTAKSREAEEEKINASGPPDADAGELKRRHLLRRSGKARPDFGVSGRSGGRGFSPEPFCLSSCSTLPLPMG
jgi:hypothetical protein